MSEDIEKLKKIIEDQKKEIERLSKDNKAFFEHSKLGIVYLDKNGSFKEVNSKFCEIMGYEKKELLGLSLKDITHPEDVELDLKSYENSKLDGKDGVILEKRFIKKDGSIIYIESFIKHVRNENADVEYSFSIVSDVTKRKKIQNTIVEQTKTMQMYMDIVNVMIIVVDIKGTITLVNKKACEVLGYEEYQLLGRNWFRNYLPEDLIEKSEEYFQSILAGKKSSSEKHINNIKTKDGIKTISWRNNVIKDKGEVVSVISSGEDITDILKLEEEKERNEKVLQNQSKLASMGEMLRNIAHQWRQPLSTISTAASGIKIQKELNILKDEEFASSMEMIVETTQYLSQTIDDFQNYFKMDSKIKSFTCKSLFTNIKNLLIANFKAKDIELVFKDKSSEVEVQGLFNELLQVLINIINNAHDSFIEKDLESRVIYMLTKLEDEDLIIEIKDNAGGIPEKIINRIFEPYFTTKHQSLGTGIGLYMAKDIIENRLNGSISVDNENVIYKDIERKGATFRVRIPIIA